MPSARAAPRTKVVFPAPTSPLRTTTSPGRSSAATRAPSASVSAADRVRCRSLEGVGIDRAQPQADAEEDERRADERQRARVGAGVGEPLGGLLLPGRAALAGHAGA